jgi:hypothetical protein
MKQALGYGEGKKAFLVNLAQLKLKHGFSLALVLLELGL